jgi:ubiquitin-activating enzyme E1
MVIGLGGLGVEVAKNIILAGVGECHLLDDAAATIQDLNSNFFLTEADVGKNRAECCVPKLAELNKYCKVRLASEFSSAEGFTVVCATNASVAEQQRLNALCRKDGVKFVSGSVQGLLASVFVDYGDSHIVNDSDGERPKRGLIAGVSNEAVGVVRKIRVLNHSNDSHMHVCVHLTMTSTMYVCVRVVCR